MTIHMSCVAIHHACVTIHIVCDRWKRGQRDNDVGGMMSAIARKMTAEDMRAISEYYERVANPLTTKDPQ